MIEVKYRNCCDVVNISGRTIADAREQYEADFEIPDNAIAKLNGKKVKRELESERWLNDGDELSFADCDERPSVRKRGKGVILIAVLFIALFLSSGWFAYTYTTSTTTFTINTPSGGADFVVVSANNTSPLTWNASGSAYGATGNGTLFDIDTTSSNFTGNLDVSIYFKNGYQLTQAYRILNLDVALYNSSGNLVDINGDGSANISSDTALLTLKNGLIELSVNQTSADIYTVWVIDGYFYTLSNWPSGYASPDLYCEATNR